MNQVGLIILNKLQASLSYTLGKKYFFQFNRLGIINKDNHSTTKSRHHYAPSLTKITPLACFE